MPLKAGKSKETISGNIGEMMHSETFAKGKPRKKKRQMAIAAAYSKSRGGKPRRSLAKDAMRHDDD